MKIQVENLSYYYNYGQINEKKALDSINLEISEKDFIGLIGHTGSGKSTLIQHFNGLYKASQGRVLVSREDLNDKNTDMLKVRQKVGMVFQYPEHQLFEETIYKDIAFGPTNIGLDPETVENRVKDAMNLVGLDYQKLKDVSPFDLSGGQKRRVAIAGVLAMEPRILVLDEPTAGLDPRGREEILSYLKKLNQETKIGIVLVSHSMEDVARVATRVLVMDQGRLVMDKSPREVFSDKEALEKIGLSQPRAKIIMEKLKEKHPDISTDALTIEEARDIIVNYFKGGLNA